LIADAGLREEEESDSEDDFERKMKDRRVKKEQERNKHLITEMGHLGTHAEDTEDKDEASESLFGFSVDTLVLIFQVSDSVKKANPFLAILHFIDVDIL